MEAPEDWSAPYTTYYSKVLYDTIYARFGIEYTVTFDSKGGSKVSPVKINCELGGATVKLPKAPTKDFYEFRVWEDKHGTPILDGALLTCEDVTLYAVWEYDGPEANTEH